VKSIVLILRALISVLGICLVALGILFWTGHALSLMRLHMMLGGLFVLTLWGLTALGLMARGTRPLALVVLIWSLIVPALGVEQLQLLPGSDHWIIQVAHLLVGIIAMGLGHSLARRLGRAAVASAVPQSA
jgi:hypothetical protein